jgi:hypothetical protein
MQTKTSGYGNILMFDKSVSLELRNKPQRCEHGRLAEPERIAEIGMMACSISHDMRHSLWAIYANAEFLERCDICPRRRVDLLLEIQEAAFAMTECMSRPLSCPSARHLLPEGANYYKKGAGPPSAQC